MERLKTISRKKMETDKKPHNFGTGYLLQYAEMFLIEMLGVHEGLSMTRLAALMQLTKGAISQTFKKLEQKGLVRKENDPENASRAHLFLTPAGYAVLSEHREWHEEKDADFIDYLNSLNLDETSLIRNFLDQYESFLDKRR